MPLLSLLLLLNLFNCGKEKTKQQDVPKIESDTTQETQIPISKPEADLTQGRSLDKNNPKPETSANTELQTKSKSDVEQDKDGKQVSYELPNQVDIECLNINITDLSGKELADLAKKIVAELKSKIAYQQEDAEPNGQTINPLANREEDIVNAIYNHLQSIIYKDGQLIYFVGIVYKLLKEVCNSLYTDEDYSKLQLDHLINQLYNREKQDILNDLVMKKLRILFENIPTITENKLNMAKYVIDSSLNETTYFDEEFYKKYFQYTNTMINFFKAKINESMNLEMLPATCALMFPPLFFKAINLIDIKSDINSLKAAIKQIKEFHDKKPLSKKDESKLDELFENINNTNFYINKNIEEIKYDVRNNQTTEEIKQTIDFINKLNSELFPISDKKEELEKKVELIKSMLNEELINKQQNTSDEAESDTEYETEEDDDDNNNVSD